MIKAMLGKDMTESVLQRLTVSQLMKIVLAPLQFGSIAAFEDKGVCHQFGCLSSEYSSLQLFYCRIVHTICRTSSRSPCKSALSAAARRAQSTRSKNASNDAACKKRI
jgi:hypothetical protein